MRDALVHPAEPREEASLTAVLGDLLAHVRWEALQGTLELDELSQALGAGVGSAVPAIGKSDIVNGEGTFSEVKDISEIFGTYAKAEASGAGTKGGAAQAMTKGEISLAIAGSGRGWDVGVSLGGLTIKKK